MNEYRIINMYNNKKFKHENGNNDQLKFHTTLITFPLL